MYPTANAIITDVLDCVLLTQQKKNPLRSRELSNKNQEIRSRYYIRILRKSESLEIPNDFIQKMIIDNNDIVAFETKELDRQNILDWFESLNDNVFVLIALEG